MEYKDYCQLRVDLKNIIIKHRSNLIEVFNKDFIPMTKSNDSNGSFSIPNVFRTTIDGYKLKIKDLLQSYNINQATPYEDFDEIWTPLYNEFIITSIVPIAAGPKPSITTIGPLFLSAKFQAFIDNYLKQVEQLCLSQISETVSCPKCPKCGSNEHVVFLPASEEPKTDTKQVGAALRGINPLFLSVAITGPNISNKSEEKKDNSKDKFRCEKCGFEFEAK